MSDLMTFSYKGYRFQKRETSGTVNIYNEKTNKEVHMFTNYEIGDDYKEFRERCISIYKEDME